MKKLPDIPQNAKVLISVGSHAPFSKELETAVDNFCAAYDAVVLVDHSSGYRGKYAVNAALAAAQNKVKYDHLFNGNLLIHIGEQTGEYYTFGKLQNRMEVWRVSEDGELRDTFQRLTKVFEMTELQFFNYYANNLLTLEPRTAQLKIFKNDLAELRQQIPERPFSNIWLAQQAMPKLPENCLITFGLSNTMRSWTFFELKNSIVSRSNIGTRGIDGVMSTLVGMSLAQPNRLHFCILGDLALFYDMNALGNRDIKNNLRIMLVNNGRGTEFRMYNHHAAIFGGDAADPFIAAAGHFGNQSRALVKHYAEDLGFEYLTASNKEEYLQNVERFVTAENLPRPILFEVFTNPKEESDALYMIQHLVPRYFSSTGINFPRVPIFCGEKIFAEPARKLFGNYTVIESENHQLNLGAVINQGKLLVFFVNDYPRLKNFLEQNGLREKIHFIDGKTLMRPTLPPPRRLVRKTCAACSDEQTATWIWYYENAAA